MSSDNCRNFPSAFRNKFFLLFGFFFWIAGPTFPEPSKGLPALEGRIRYGIRAGEFPGAVMLVMHKGKVLLKKGWGETATGSGIRPDPDSSVYDLASVSKAIGTAAILMHFYEKGRFRIEDSLGLHLPAARGFPLGRLRIGDLLAHRTGLPPYYISNYWLLSKNRWKESSFSPFPTAQFPDPYRGLYMPKGYREQMLRDLAQLPFRGRPKTVYSDLNYILLGALAEQLAGMRQDQFLEQWLFREMGLRRTCYNPLLKGIAAREIIPSMAGPYGHGWVHDAEAGKLAGVCGAAGLFSTAAELGKIGEMLCRGGKFRGKQIFRPETIRKFAWQRQHGHARSMGWQKPAGGNAKRSIAPAAASAQSFGHSGHTGALLWVDPVKDLVVVFLANITYPDDAPSAFVRKAGYRQILSLAYGLR